MSIKDPTHDEMLAFLATVPFAEEFDDFDREDAIYWFAANYHSGQWSNLYSALSTSSYSPGRLQRGPSVTSTLLYEELEAEYAQSS